MSQELSHLNRAQRRRVERKLEKYEPPSLEEWLSEPNKLVKRGELWNLLDRWERIQKLKEQYYSPMARFQRFLRRLAPWMDDPPPDPFAASEGGKTIAEVVAEEEQE